MSDEVSKFPELKGKVIEGLSVSRDRTEGTEVHIEFSDGTSFSCCVTSRQKTEASLLRCGGSGDPEVLKRLL